MELATSNLIEVGEDGSIKLPPAAQEAIGVRPGDRILVRVDAQHRTLILEPKRVDLRDLFGILSKYVRPGHTLSVEQMDEAVAAHVAADHARIVGVDRA